MLSSGFISCVQAHSIDYLWTGRIFSSIDQFSGSFGASSCARSTNAEFGSASRNFVGGAPRHFSRRNNCFTSCRNNVKDGDNGRGVEKRGGIGPHRCSNARKEDLLDGERESNCLYLRKTIESGEVVEHSGSVVIFGDVKPGGHVLAGADVIVLGRLQGQVHAGKLGVASSKIFASAMEPREIRICDSALFCPKHEGRMDVAKMAVFLPDGRISIQRAVDEKAEQLLPPTTSQQRRRGRLFQRTSRVTQTHQDRGTWDPSPARIAFVTGIYISIAGIALLGFPKVLFGILFDLKGVAQGWVQVGAILAVVFGVYYIGTAIGDMRGENGAQAFYFSTVVGRIFLFFSFLGLVVTGAVPRPLLLVGVVNLLGALLMLNALLKGSSQ